MKNISSQKTSLYFNSRNFFLFISFWWYWLMFKDAFFSKSFFVLRFFGSSCFTDDTLLLKFTYTIKRKVFTPRQKNMKKPLIFYNGKIGKIVFLLNSLFEETWNVYRLLKGVKYKFKTILTSVELFIDE